jgi:hypothetical protein
MTILHIESTESEAVLHLVRSAVDSEILRFELALQSARKRLAAFEEKYSVTSAHFIAHFTAEDLEGGDDEYVQWAGEYRLMERLEEKLRRLQEIEYSDTNLL